MFIMEYTASGKTVAKWENELNIKLEKTFKNNRVVLLKCVVRKKFESQIKGLRTYNPTWVTGSKYIKKDFLQKHIPAEPHIVALNL